MNHIARDIIMRRRREDHRRDYGNYYIKGEYDKRGDYNYPHHQEDYRQGVKGTGRYGIGGSRYYGDRYDKPEHEHDYRYDYDDYRMNDYRYDYADEPMTLSKNEMKHWKKSLENADGSLGERFGKDEIEDIAEKMNIRYKNYDEDDLCMTANMLYSDYSNVTKKYVPQDREPMFYTELAKAFLEDKDASAKGAEKLAVYYHCIVKDDEE